MFKTIRNFLIKLLGGYTKKEYQRSEQKYQGLLDSITDNKSAYLCNEYIMRTLQDLDSYARSELYGVPSDSWAHRMYNIIHNNMLRVMIRYVHSKSSLIYKLDTTLDSDKQFESILKSENKEIPQENDGSRSDVYSS